MTKGLTLLILAKIIYNKNMSKRNKLSKGKKKLPKAYVQPIGDGDSMVWTVNNGEEVLLDTPIFEEYGDEAIWCYENGYQPIYGESFWD